MSNPQNKLMILCNPHNPTGRVFDRADLETIADLAKKHGVIVVSDEIFAEVTFDGHTATPYCQISPENSIVLTSLGKTFNFTGVNHANAIIREPVLRERYLAQRRADHFGSIDPFFYTAIRAAYSEAGLAWVREMREHTWQNYLVMKGCFADRLPDFRLSPLEGTYVAWIDCRGLGLNDQELAAFFRECANVIVDPGTDYGPGGSGFVRISIATPRSQIQRFLDLLTQGCNTIRKRRSAS